LISGTCSHTLYLSLLELTAETGFKRMELRIVDLNNFASVSTFSDNLDKEGIQVDVAVLNAGIHTFDYEKSSDGYESTFVFLPEFLYYS
jgi:short-subunit dehydrogenase